MRLKREDVERGVKVSRGAVVDQVYHSSLGAETVKVELYHNHDKERIKRRMSKIGYVYHFTRDSIGHSGKMWFRDEDEWNMEPGAGDS